jgi:flagellar biosynthesis anti-sigma factor FlgM
MRIDNNDLSGLSSSAAGASQKIRITNQESSAAAKPGKASKGEDQVQLSSVADRVSAGSFANDRAVSAERSTRIDQLTKLVQSGKYQADPGQIADSMIGDMLSATGSA